MHQQTDIFLRKHKSMIITSGSMKILTLISKLQYSSKTDNLSQKNSIKTEKIGMVVSTERYVLLLHTKIH